MKKKPTKDTLASMEFLDGALDDYADGYPSENTEAFYETLKVIRQTQNKGEVPEEAYKALGVLRGYGSIEYGYYLANIHYYLYADCLEFQLSGAHKKSVNERIKFFLENADPSGLTGRGWFPLNFPFAYLHFLEGFYGRYRQESMDEPLGALMNLCNLVDRYGDSLEKEIVALARPILEGYWVQKCIA